MADSSEQHHSHKRHRDYYLADIPLEEAMARFFGALEESGALSPTPGEAVPLDQALGRTTAGPVWAKLSSPGSTPPPGGLPAGAARPLRGFEGVLQHSDSPSGASP